MGMVRKRILERRQREFEREEPSFPLFFLQL